MKKYIVGALMIYFLIALGLFAFVKDKPDSITILSKKSNYSRILTDNEETIDIPLYFSVDNSFFTSSENIDSVSIHDEFNEIGLKISKITNTKETYEFKQKLYDLFIFSFISKDIEISDIEMKFVNAFLSLTYENDVSYDFSIGDIDLNFKEIANDGYLDLTRLYGVVNQNADGDFLAGIVLGLDNIDDKNITISNIDTGIEDIILDLDNSVKLDKPVDINQNIDLILENDYQNLKDSYINNGYLTFSEETLYFIPIRYIDKFENINRFPLVIEYQCNDQEYSYTIDDFLFYTTNYALGVQNETVTEYIYKY